ncbi:DUF5615 family PIN-like protein [Calothrix sp. NIES-2098]|uniref:DUF5615 family PIN-like protein n=1 Tax=Calothrix sp. NIES-2098 TaxID=1954171 RepID=UPI000B60112B|nr:hypothetical protein NIES2098_66810 [Calothrix sp. NIES-2098]
MTIRFQADADFNQNIVSGVLRREPKIDFQTALVTDLEGLQDIEVLDIAAKEGRILVSHDRRTMPFHFAEYIATQTSAGVLIISQDLPIQEAINSLILIWAASDAQEWINRIVFLPF